MTAYTAQIMNKRRIKADKASVVVAIATLTVVAVVALASPAFSFNLFLG